MRRFLEILLALAVLALLLWPALANGYPLLYPDTLDYVGTGRAAWLSLVRMQNPAFNAVRSAIYAAGIYPFHWTRTPWPVLALNAAAVVFTVYLVTRSLVQRDAWRKTGAILAALSICTGLSWYTSFVMPDIFGAPLYLAIYLFAFARETLRRGEQIALAVLAVFGATVHAAHLLVAMCLCAMLWLLRLVGRSSMTVRNLGIVTSVIAGAVLLQLGVNLRLYSHASLAGNSPPFAEARILSDGTGARYLKEHCAEHVNWVLCHHLDRLPVDEDDFLWAENGMWSALSYDEQDEIRREQVPLILATVRAYPRQQLAVSWLNFWGQLVNFALDDFDNNEYMQTTLNAEIPNARAAYDRSLQARNAMPERFFSILQELTVLASLLLIAFALPATLRRPDARRRRLLGLTGVIGIAVVINALVSGVLSAVDSRYQARVIWLIPLLAAFYLLELPIFARRVE